METIEVERSVETTEVEQSVEITEIDDASTEQEAPGNDASTEQEVDGSDLDTAEVWIDSGIAPYARMPRMHPYAAELFYPPAAADDAGMGWVTTDPYTEDPYTAEPEAADAAAEPEGDAEPKGDAAAEAERDTEAEGEAAADDASSAAASHPTASFAAAADPNASSAAASAQIPWKKLPQTSCSRRERMPHRRWRDLPAIGAPPSEARRRGVPAVGTRGSASSRGVSVSGARTWASSSTVPTCRTRPSASSTGMPTVRAKPSASSSRAPAPCRLGQPGMPAVGAQMRPAREASFVAAVELSGRDQPSEAETRVWV